MTPQEFVERVFHTQEGVLLKNLYPSSNKYQEVMLSLHRVISEFEREQDWSWLRHSIFLGDTNPNREGLHKVPRFILPNYVDRVSMVFDDSIKLHRFRGKPKKNKTWYDIDEDDYITVPYASMGSEMRRPFGVPYKQLQARVYKNYIEFNRTPNQKELNRAILCDVQIKMHRPHRCTSACIGKDKSKPISYKPGEDYNPCRKIEREIFKDMPYEDYFVLKTAYYNGQHSEIAQAVLMNIDANCKTLLSKIKANDVAKTAPDFIKRPQVFRPVQTF